MEAPRLRAHRRVVRDAEPLPQAHRPRYFAALYSGDTRSPSSLLAAVGLQDDADKRVGHYSKGMRCRLGVARSLLPNPQLLFLDEPTAPMTRADLKRLERESIIRALEQTKGRSLGRAGLQNFWGFVRQRSRRGLRRWG